jgi:hypothetical protein
VPYDGVVLPLVSPDGKLLAVEQGTAPGWPALLATDDAVLPLATTLAVYDLGVSPPKRVEFVEALPPGLMLGRAADHEGFLVEWPRPEGGRWIGKVAWASGRMEWLVQGDAINAHAVLTTGGELLFTRRSPGRGITELVLRSREGRENPRLAYRGSYSFPMAPLDPAAVYALMSSEAGLEVEAIGITREPPLSGDARWGATLARSGISNNGEASMAYQIAAPTQATATLWRRDGQQHPEPLAVYHPRMERMGAFDKAGGTFAPLAEKSIAAAWWGTPGEQGFFCTGPEGLVFTPVAEPGTARTGQEARVLGGAFVARATNDPERPFVLLGPSRRDPGRIEVAVMGVVREPGAAGQMQ